MHSPSLAFIFRLGNLLAVAILDLLRKVASKEDRILFMSARRNHSISSAHLDGYTRLYAMGHDTRVYREPYNKQVRYVYGDLCHTHFPNSFFKAVILEADSSEERDAAWREAERVVQGGGAIIFSDGRAEWTEKSGPGSIEDIDILLTVRGQGGITEYTKVMLNRERVERQDEYPCVAPGHRGRARHRTVREWPIQCKPDHYRCPRPCWFGPFSLL